MSNRWSTLAADRFAALTRASAARRQRASGRIEKFLLAAAAFGIFILDTLTDRDIAVSVFYVLVIIAASNLLPRKGLKRASLFCFLLTLVSFGLSSGGSWESALTNLLIGVVAIGATTYLLVQIDHAETEARSAQEQLAHVSRLTTLNELTTTIAHELNQPLAAIVLNCAAATRWLDMSPLQLDEARSSIDRVARDANRANDVVKRIKALAGKASPTHERLSINDIAVDALDLSRARLERDGIQVVTDLGPNLPDVLGDRILLQQVFLNLIFNAAQAMTGAASEARLLRIETAAAEMNQISASVIDSGRGIAADDLETVFDPFHTTKTGGIGMGLTICRNIIERHGGRIWADRVANGARLTFLLPRS